MSEQISANRQSSPSSAAPAPARARPRRWLVRLAWLSLGFGVICGLLELLLGPAYRLGWVGLRPALQTIRWAASAEAVVLVFALLGSVAAFRQGSGRAKAIFLGSSIVGVLVVGQPAVLWYRVQHLPHLHDISTDTVNPPEYVSVLPARSGAPNSTVYDSKLVSLQVQAYPDIRALRMTAPPDQLFRKALRIAREMGWEIVAADQDALRIEATDTSLLFGFKDDVAVRIVGEPGGSRIDLRSLSRVGGSDFGVNAKRIRKFLSLLQEAGR